MPDFTIWIPGEPKGQPRPRAFSRGGVARVYDPGTAEGWKSAIAVAVRPYILPKPVETGFQVSAWFYFPRPKSHFGKKGLRETAPQDFLKKPDLDNVVKALADALTQVGLWKDDSQITDLHVWKRWETERGPGTWLSATW